MLRLSAYKSGLQTSMGVSDDRAAWFPQVTDARTYGPANGLNQASSMAGQAFTWNDNGNLTYDGSTGTTFTFDQANRLTSAGRSGTSAAYAYDPEDRRTKKTVNGVVTRMLWSGAEELAQLDASGAVLRRFVPGPAGMDDRIAYVETSGTVTWPHTDRLGSVVAVSNGAGQATDLTGYSPWGEMPAGRTLPPGGVFGYTGRERDAETGLWQYRARYYHERGGFFLSTDPVGTKDDPNLYMYVGLDPVNRTDPTGLCGVFIRQCIGAGVGFGIELVGQLANPETRSDYAAAGKALSRGDFGGAIDAAGGHALGLVTAAGAGALGTKVDSRVASALGQTALKKVAPVLGGAAGGATAGGTQAAATGGDIRTGVVVGGSIGALAKVNSNAVRELAADAVPARVPGSGLQIMPGKTASGASSGLASGAEKGTELVGEVVRQ